MLSGNISRGFLGSKDFKLASPLQSACAYAFTLLFSRVLVRESSKFEMRNSVEYSFIN